MLPTMRARFRSAHFEETVAGISANWKRAPHAPPSASSLAHIKTMDRKADAKLNTFSRKKNFTP
jgi:hypothetical protein